MNPEDQAFDLINAGLNAIIEQLQRVNKELEQLVDDLSERQRESGFIESRAEEHYYETGKWPKG